MKIFPYVLTRLGGAPYDLLNALANASLTARTNDLLESERERDSKKRALTAALLEFIQGLADRRTQNAVQNFRRDIFNDRPVASSKIEHVMSLLAPDLKISTANYFDVVAKHNALRKEVERLYEKCSSDARRQLKQLAKLDSLRKGLLLSSESLYQSIDRASFMDTQLARQVEHGILKYLTRMCAKTSPFSTFNNLAVGMIKDGDDQALWMDADYGTGEVKGRVSLNNNLYKYLRVIFFAYRDVYVHFSLRANPTITAKDDHYTFLTNHHNVEAFQRIPLNAVIQLILKKVRSAVGGVKFSLLIERIASEIDATPDEIEKYIKQLVDYGFLEYDLGISGIDPEWDIKLCDYLAPIALSVPTIGELVVCLTFLRATAEKVAVADALEREALLDQAYLAVRERFMKLHEEAGLPEHERRSRDEILTEFNLRRKQERERKIVAGPKEPSAEQPAKNERQAFQHKSPTYFTFTRRQIFYEDTIRDVMPRFASAELTDLVTELNTLLRKLALFDGKRNETEKMYSFYVSKFGDMPEVNLLTFYEEYAREGTKSKVEASPSPAKSEGETAARPTERNELIKKWNERQQNIFAEQLKIGADEILINANHVTDAGRGGMSQATSFGAFLQFFQERDTNGRWKLKAMVNGSFGGYGRMFSRFLHVLPKDVTDRLISWNRKMQPDNALYIEDCDGSFFNANLHPPLLPYEVRIPGGNNYLPPSQQLPVQDFVVRRSSAEHELQLFHKPSGKRSYVFDLGFEGPGRRSPLFKLMDKFTKVEFLSPFPLTNAINNWTLQATGGEGKRSVVIKPRIVYEDKLILQRKTWLIAADALPLRTKQVDDAGYFFEINRWRIEHKMPRAVFVFVKPLQFPGQNSQTLNPKAGRDDYKPQYIDFENPLLVGLFERLLVKVSQTLRIEEMLPAPGSLLKIGDEGYVNEYVVQWYDLIDD